MTAGEAEDPARRVAKSFATGVRPGGNAAAPATAPATAPSEAAAQGQTVVDYLERMSREKGVSYRYAWWNHPHWQRAIWTAGSFVLVGLVWPTVVNVLAFGTLRRPPEEAAGPSWGEALGAVFRRRRVKSPARQAARVDVDAAALGYDAALEARLAARGEVEPDPIGAIGPDLPPPHAAPPALSAAPEPVPAGAAPHEEHQYEAKKDDFYPTEKRPAHHP